MGTIGPSLPPDLASKRKRPNESPSTSPPPAKRSRSNSPASKQSRIIGPALPPASPPASPKSSPAAPTTAVIPPAEASSSDDDSDFGPALPSAADTSINPDDSAQLPSSNNNAPSQPSEPVKPQREEWMLAPPSSADWTSRIDPTKMKNRRFQSGKAATSSRSRGGASGEVDTLWTETPEQKRQRLEDEVLGRRGLATKGGDDGDGGAGGKDGAERRDREARRRKEEEERKETERNVREYNEERGRGGSLVDAHQKRREGREGKTGRGKPNEEEDDPSKRAFDREKDMGLGGKIGHKARSDMTKQAKGFGGRFGAGGFL